MSLKPRVHAAMKDKYGPLLQAAALAARAHQGQFRKDRITPYASHPFRVCLVVGSVFGFQDLDMLQTAVLHDTLEDTTTDFDDLAATFGTRVAEWVALLSKDKRLPEDAREQAYCQALARAPWQVKACKLADMFDNLMDLGNLPAARAPASLARIKNYLATLEKDAPAELHKPLAIVRELLETVSQRGAFS